MKEESRTLSDDIVNSVLVNNWMSSSAMVAACLAGLVWIFRMAIKDQVKKEIDPLASDIASMKIQVAVIKNDIQSIKDNTHAIKNSEAAEEGTIKLLLQAVRELNDKIENK